MFPLPLPPLETAIHFMFTTVSRKEVEMYTSCMIWNDKHHDICNLQVVFFFPPDREDDLEQALQDIISRENIDMGQSANIFVARDTRPSSVGLAEVLIDGIQAFKGQYSDYGEWA